MKVNRSSQSAMVVMTTARNAPHNQVCGFRIVTPLGIGSLNTRHRRNFNASRVPCTRALKTAFESLAYVGPRQAIFRPLTRRQMRGFLSNNKSQARFRNSQIGMRIASTLSSAE